MHRADDKGGKQLDYDSADQRAIVLERGAGLVRWNRRLSLFHQRQVT